MNRIISEEQKRAMFVQLYDDDDGDYAIFCHGWKSAQKALQPPNGQVGEVEKERDEWKGLAQLLGEGLSSVGPEGYYSFTLDQFRSWLVSLPSLRQPVETVDVNAGYSAFEESDDWSCYKDREKREMAFRAGVSFALRTQPQAPRPGQNRFGVDYDDGGFKVHCKDRGVVLHLSHDEANDLVSQLPQPQAPVVEVPSVDLIEGSLYLNSTDEGDDGKWIEAKDYRKVAQAIALLQYRNEPVEVTTIAELKSAYQTGFDKEWESPEWTGDDDDEDDMDRRDASIEAGWEAIHALLQSRKEPVLEVCHCGMTLEDHRFETHTFTPMEQPSVVEVPSVEDVAVLIYQRENKEWPDLKWETAGPFTKENYLGRAKEILEIHALLQSKGGR